MLSLITVDFSAILCKENRPIISWTCLYATQLDV